MLKKIIAYKFIVASLLLSLSFLDTAFASSDEDGDLDLGAAAPQIGGIPVNDEADGDAAAAAFAMPYFDIKENYASPKTDTGFKHLFSRDAPTSLAISFLNAVVPEFATTPVQSLEELSEALPLLRRKGERQAFMDYHVRTADGKHIVVEMQVKRHVAFDERALFYAASTYSQQISKKTLGNKGWYEGLHPVYAVQIIDYDTNRVKGITADIDDLLVDRVKAHPMQEGEFIKHYKMTDQRSGQTIDHLQMIQLELPRIQQQLFSSKRSEYKHFTEFQWWMSLFVHSDKYTKKRVKRRWKDMPASIKEAFKRLDMSQWESDLKEAYVADVKDLNAYRAVIEAERAAERSIIEATHKRKAEAEKKETVTKMIADGLPKKKIKEYTGMKIREIKRMKKELKDASKRADESASSED